MFQHLIGDFVWARGLLVLQGFQGLFKLICVEWAVHVVRWILINLVLLDFIMYLLFPVVWYHDVADLLSDQYCHTVRPVLPYCHTNTAILSDQ